MTLSSPSTYNRALPLKTSGKGENSRRGGGLGIWWDKDPSGHCNRKALIRSISFEWGGGGTSKRRLSGHIVERRRLSKEKLKDTWGGGCGRGG